MENMLPGRASSILQPIRPLKRVEYDELVKLGFFVNEKVELIYGMVVAMSPIDPAHTESVRRIDEFLMKALAGRARVFSQSPLAATDDSEPEPDVLVVPLRDYWLENPETAHLIVEVARSSLRHDRVVKAELYGLSDVREYWIVNHVHGVVEVYRDRADGFWRSIQTYGRGQSISPIAFPDVSIPVDEIMPPAEYIGTEPSDGKKRD
jgi:Uma2 family endonuclease